MTAAEGGAAAAAAAQNANIKKMIGPVAFIDEKAFTNIVDQAPGLIVAHSHQGFLSKKHHYITNAFGLTWYCKTKNKINFKSAPALVPAEKISVPE